jgi:hypothetical protein
MENLHPTALFAGTGIPETHPGISRFRAMPVLRKLIVVAAVDGLILHGNGGPRFNSSNNEASAIRIDYKTNKITALPTLAPDAFEGRDVLESYGLVGESVLDSRTPRNNI